MRIVHFLNHTLIANGHVNVAVDLACEQVQRGHDVFILAGDSDHRDTLSAAGVRYIQLPMEARGSSSALSFKTVRALPGMFEFLRASLYEVRPHIVHSHMSFAAVMAWATRLGAPWRLVTTVHNSFDRQSVLMGLADRTVCVSRAVADRMATRGVPQSKLVSILNGSRGSARLPAIPMSIRKLEHPSLSVVAGLHHRKGVQDLIQAFALVALHHPTVHLYVVGSGPSEAEYQQLARRTSYADRIHFLGHLDDPRTVLLDTDVFVMPSHSDPFPLAVLEAMDAGCAVVATQVDGIPEALDFGAAGLLVPPKDPSALAAAIRRVLDDPETLKSLRSSATERGRLFSVERMTGEYLMLYDALLAANPAAKY